MTTTTTTTGATPRARRDCDEYIIVHHVVLSLHRVRRRLARRLAPTRATGNRISVSDDESSTERRTCASTAPATPRESVALDTFSANSFRLAFAACALADLRIEHVSRRKRQSGFDGRSRDRDASHCAPSRAARRPIAPSRARIKRIKIISTRSTSRRCDITLNTRASPPTKARSARCPDTLARAPRLCGRDRPRRVQPRARVRVRTASQPSSARRRSSCRKRPIA